MSSRTVLPRGALAAAVVTALALAIRLLYLADVADSPTFAVPIVDALEYDAAARRLVSTGAFDAQFFRQPFLYPFFLAALYQAGGGILAAKIVQAFAGAAVCLLVVVAGWRLVDRRTGLVAGTITALYGPLVFYGGELLATVWAAFWAVTLVLLLVEARTRTARWPALLLGPAAGLAILTRPTFLPFVVAGLAWLGIAWLRDARHASTRLRRALLVAAGFAAVTVPVAFACERVTGRFGFLPASGGINLYVGNHPDTARMLTVGVGEDWRQVSDLPLRDGITGIWERDGWYYDRVRDHLVEQPAAFAAGLLAKTTRLLSSREIPRNVDIHVQREHSLLLTVLAWRLGGFGFPFGVLLPLAVLGAWRLGRRLPLPVALFVTLYGAAVVAVFVTARYRLPMVPVLALPAAAGAIELCRLARSRQWRPLAARAVAAVVIGLVATLPGPFPEEQQRFDADLWSNIAHYHMRGGDREKALALYRRALAIDPDHAEANLNAGNLLAERGQAAAALAHYDAAARRKPWLAAVHASRGALLLDRGRTDDAVAALRRAIAADPTIHRAHMNLGIALQRGGALAAAIAAHREAVRLGPDNPLTHYNLGVALGQRGDHAAAIAAYRAAVALRADDVRLRYGLAFALERAGRVDEAIDEYRAVLQRAPGFMDARARLQELRDR